MVGSIPVGNFAERINEWTPSIWKRMSSVQRMIVAGAAATAVALSVGLTVWSQQPEYARLYETLSPEDSAAVIGKLKESHVPYQLADGGATIMVPSRDVLDTRVSLAGQGIPSGGRVGFEVFDKNIFGMPEFVQKLNYQRALEGELERTINQINGVESSRVHLVVPKTQLFTEAQKAATASITLKMKPNTKVNAQQVSSVRHLVASSVEGLKPKDITITDTEGKLLQDAATPDASTSQLDAKRTYERTVEQALSTMLDQTVGIDPITGLSKASVRVNAVMNWDQIEATSETYSPVSSTGVAAVPQPRSVRSLEENFSGTGAPPEGGVPGSTTNVPPTYFGGSSNGPSDYSRKDTTTNYEISKEVKKTVPTPGGVQRLSVAVLVPDTIPSTQVANIEALVAAAAGLDRARGDVVSVAALPLDTSIADAAQQALRDQQVTEITVTGMKIVGGLAALALILFGLGRTVGAPRVAAATMVSVATPPEGASQPKEVDASSMAPMASVTSEAPAPAALPVPKEEVQRMLEEERRLAAEAEAAENNRQEEEAAAEKAREDEEAKEEANASFAEMARNDPERLAEVLQIWLSEDKGRR
jgi:flagellar M-ring protein FliF